MTQRISDAGTGLALEHLRTLAYAAAFIRGAPRTADSIEVTLPPLEGTATGALERACALAVAESALEAEITFAVGATTVRLARAGCL